MYRYNDVIRDSKHALDARKIELLSCQNRVAFFVYTFVENESLVP